MRLWIEQFEGRIVPATITWDATDHPTGGSWDAGVNWIGGVAPGANDDAVINLTSAGNVSLAPGVTDSVKSVTTNSNTTFSVNNGSLTLGTDQSTFGGVVTIPANGSLIVGTGSKFAIADNVAVAVNGTLTANNPASFIAQHNSGGSTDSITVNTGGTFAATNTNFTTTGSGTSLVQVKSGGRLTATGSTFGWSVAWDDGAILGATDVTNNAFDGTVYVQPAYVPLLANNTSFQDVDLNSGSSIGATPLDLPVLGGSSTLQRYVIPSLTGYNGTYSPFTIAAGATVTIDKNTSVVIPDTGYTGSVVVNGTLTVTDPASFVAQFTVDHGDTDSIVVDSGGTLAVAGTDFTTTGSEASTGTSLVQVKSGGRLMATGSTFGWSVAWDDGAILGATDVTGNAFDGTVYVQPAYVPLLANNTSFQDVDLNSGSSIGATPLDLPVLGGSSTLQRYVIPSLTGYNGTYSPFTIAAGATVTIDKNTSVVIPDTGYTGSVVVNGTLTVTDPASFVAQFTVDHGDTDSIVVDSGGTLAVAGTDFTTTGSEASTGTSLVQVKSGGRLTATGSTFGWSVAWDDGAILGATDVTNNAFDGTVYVQPAYIPLLANNTSFQDIDLNSGSSIGATPLDLPVLGGSSTLQRYVIPSLTGYNGTYSPFTIAAGATVTIDKNTSVVIPDTGYTGSVVVNGTLTVTDPASFVAQFTVDHGDTDSIVVDSGGTLAVAGTDFATTGSQASTGTSFIQVKSGGR
ncbi:beta strand repeat-containing protein [Fimbriiglobus ruber]|uniref:beta strand repeat-containing protein n=1 Tax=Fimbriiglobus ruber TaxID=1908690 RepID=UPI00117997EA|nr:hypothetical protein [Fimbriiglobus ruber]